VKNRIVSISLVVALILTFGLIGCGQPCTLTVASTSGENISVMKKGASSWIEAQEGMSLEPGDIIKSGGSSSAQITFLDGSTIELEAGTEVEVVSLDISTDTDSTTVKVKQTIGSIIFRVTKIVDPASRYEVETPTGTVAIRGSAVQITVIEDGTTLACNLEGDIWATAQSMELQIPEGRCCIIRPGQPPKLIYNLAISSTTGGSVTTPGEGTFPYDEGTVVNLVAEPGEDHYFVSWIGDVDTIANVNASTTTITMNDNYSITAHFEEIPAGQLSLNLTSTTGGLATTPGEGTFFYDFGTVVNLVAIPAMCYLFVNWTGDVDTVANVNAATTTITMNGDYWIRADFEVGGFLSAAKTEVHQVQTAIIATMADAETAQLTTWGDWHGEPDIITIAVGNVTYDARDYIYGEFRATYTVQQDGSITNGYCDYPGGWGDSIIWDPVNSNWVCIS
jgi:hypothetical protein